MGLAASACGSDSDRFDGQMIVGVRAPATAQEIVDACGDLPTVAATSVDRDEEDARERVTFSFEGTTAGEQGDVRKCVDEFDPASVVYP